MYIHTRILCNSRSWPGTDSLPFILLNIYSTELKKKKKKLAESVSHLLASQKRIYVSPLTLHPAHSATMLRQSSERELAALLPTEGAMH